MSPDQSKRDGKETQNAQTKKRPKLPPPTLPALCVKPTFMQKSKYKRYLYDQTFNDRLGQHLRGNDVWEWIQANYEFEVTFKVARIGLPDRQRISREFVQAIESLLIGVMQPRGNIQSTQTYTRQNLRIVNLRKFKPLRSSLSTDDLA